MAKARVKPAVIPKFSSEAEEAAWWDAHPEVITELFLKARKEGRIKRLPVVNSDGVLVGIVGRSEMLGALLASGEDEEYAGL